MCLSPLTPIATRVYIESYEWSLKCPSQAKTTALMLVLPLLTVLNLAMQGYFSQRRGAVTKSPYEDMKEERLPGRFWHGSVLAGLGFICSGLGRSACCVGRRSGVTQPWSRKRWRRTFTDCCEDSDSSNDTIRSHQSKRNRGGAWL